ncbi:MAG: EAL domain-containing protein [Rubrobacter sp.]|nr:EAL domain-containing protein [Rubrobacter sp.]
MLGCRCASGPRGRLGDWNKRKALNEGKALKPGREPRPVEGRESDRLRLLQFLRWVIPLVFCFAALTTLAYLIFADEGSGVASLILICYGLLLLVARGRVRKRRRGAAITIICVGLLVATLCMSVVQPEWISVLVVTPLLAVAVALPYVRGRSLLWLIFLAWMVAVAVAVSSRFLPRMSNLPQWFMDTFIAGSIAAAVAIVMLLLWQFSSRLNDTLAQTRAAEERYALAERGVNDGLWDWNFDSDDVYYSPRWKQMLGYADYQIGSSPEEWFSRVHPEDTESLRREIKAHLDGHRSHLEVEYRLLHSDGEYRWMLSRGIAIRGPSGAAERMAGSQADITRRKEAEEKLVHDAFHDPLTGLPNRASLLDGLGRRLRSSKRYGEEGAFAVLFIDLDNFKVVNDSLGHSTGDVLLVAVAERMRASLRPRDTIARLGGDEFTVLISEVSGTEEAEQVADRLLEELQEPFPIGGYELFTTASVGIVVGDRDYEKPEDLLRDADTAMYRAKDLGRSRKGVFERTMHSRAVALFELETELRRAMEREEFVVHYQPITSLKTGRIVGFEALVRWKHPERGMIAPGEFIPIAEETGLIIPLEFFVLRESCHQIALWQRRYPERLPLTMNVNLSRNQLARPDLFDQIQHILAEANLDPRSLRLEITEGAIMRNVEYAADTLVKLRALDIQIHIDDFGTGYSSLSALHSFPVDSLKIDRTFIGRMDSGGDDTEIVQTIVTLSHNLGLDVIAEGIETRQQLDRLRDMGCDYGQGFLFAKPMDGASTEDLIRCNPQW